MDVSLPELNGLSMRRIKLPLRAESYRTLNHGNFAAPANSLLTPTFGCLTVTAHTPGGTVARVRQLALRIGF